MGVFDVFTGGPIKEAANQARGQLTSAQGTIGNLAGLSQQYNTDAIRTGYGGARQNLASGYDASTGAINTGAGSAQDYLRQGQGSAIGALDRARNDLTANGGAFAPLGDLSRQFGQGAALYGDSLGINGPEGIARARAAYTASPNFDTTFNAGIDAINRRNNALGMAGSGNAGRDAIKFAHDLSLGDYNNWQNQLGAYNNLTLNATAGAAQGNQANNQAVAGLGTTAANIYNQGGVNQAGVATGQGSALSDIARAYYGGQANLDTGEAGALTNNMNTTTGLYAGALQNLAPQIGKTYMDAGNAQVAGSGNLWNLGLNAAKLAAGVGGTTAGSGAAGGGNAFLPSSSFLNNSWGW